MTWDRIEELERDIRRGLRIAHELTPETQTVEETCADLVRLVRKARDERDRLESALTESVRKEDLEHALQRVGRLNKAVHVLYRVFEAAVVLADAWPGSSPNWDALREAIEAYRELVAPLGGQGGAEPGKPTVQP